MSKVSVNNFDPKETGNRAKFCVKRKEFLEMHGVYKYQHQTPEEQERRDEREELPEKARICTLLLEIQDDADVARGAAILRGDEALPAGKDTIQFAYDKTVYPFVDDAFVEPPSFGPSPEFFLGWSVPEIEIWQRTKKKYEDRQAMLAARSSAAKQAVGVKGDNAVVQTLATAIRTSKVQVHMRFAFCNLSSESIARLATALRENTSFTGFSCFGNDKDFDAEKTALRLAVIETPAPLEIWNNSSLSSELIIARQTLLLEIQDDADVVRGAAILKGVESLPAGKDTIQFAYNKAMYGDGICEVEETRCKYAKQAVGVKGDNAVVQTLATAIRTSKVRVHVRFAFCNLSSESIARLATALRENTSLTGFSCFGHDKGGFCADEEALRSAVIETPAPLEIWNNSFLSTAIVDARVICSRTLLLEIQNDADVVRGAAILSGEESLPAGKDTIQFAYDKTVYPFYNEDDIGPRPEYYQYDQYYQGYDAAEEMVCRNNRETYDALAAIIISRSAARSSAAKQAVGVKGDNAVVQTLATAIRTSKVQVHVRFAFCNLSSESIARLATALRENTSLTGFSCFGHDKGGFCADEEALRSAVIETPAPLEIWNNSSLSSDIVDARKQAAAVVEKSELERRLIELETRLHSSSVSSSVKPAKRVAKWLLFLSYNKADCEEVANQFYEVAKAKFPDQDIFFDLATKFSLSELVMHVQSASNVVVLLSANYPRRPFTLIELHFALASSAKICPVVIARTGLETFDFAKVSRDIESGEVKNYLDAYGWAELRKYGLGVKQVVEDLQKVMNVKAEHFDTKYPTPIQLMMADEVLKGVEVRL